MKTKILLVLILGLTFVFGGCSVKRLNAIAVEGATLNKSGKFYVVRFDPDKRNLNQIIADQMTSMGYNAVAGEKSDMPDDIDTVVTYIDHWQWDITNYMIEIDIQFRDAKDNALIVSGESYRTSLDRAAPSVMIRETLEEMLK